MKRPRILLADDHASALDGMGAILTPHYEVAGTAADGRGLVETALRLKPELIITDITMPHLSGIGAARQIKTSLPGIKLLFVTMHSSSAYVSAAFEAGGNGYLLKFGANEELLDAVQSVLNGHIYVSPDLSTDNLQRFQDPAAAATLDILKTTPEPSPMKKARRAKSRAKKAKQK
jgi:DNA-binding NarL/FixJ family response regulator